MTPILCCGQIVSQWDHLSLLSFANWQIIGNQGSKSKNNFGGVSKIVANQFFESQNL